MSRWNMPMFAEPNMPMDEMVLAEILQLEGETEQYIAGIRGRDPAEFIGERIQFEVDDFMRCARPASRVLREGYKSKYRPWGYLSKENP